MLYRTNVALLLKGDRIEKGREIELTDEEAKALDPADISPVSYGPDVSEPEPVYVPLNEMDFGQLKAKAKELGLSQAGGKADILERITLHLTKPVDETTTDDETTITNDNEQ